MLANALAVIGDLQVSGAQCNLRSALGARSHDMGIVRQSECGSGADEPGARYIVLSATVSS